MSTLSLMVDCTKIIKWLQQRKKLPKDWYNYIKAAQQKLKILLKDQQQLFKYQQIKKYIQQNQETFCYYDINNLVKMLQKTQLGQEKSILFGYSNKCIKQWINLKKFIQSKHLSFISNAKLIQQCLKFQLPGLSKNIQMMDTQLSNLRRKNDFNSNTIFQQQKQIKKQIHIVGLNLNDQNISIKSFNIQKQIPHIIRKVPKTIQQIQILVDQSNIKDIINIYKQKIRKDGLNCQIQLLQYFVEYKNDYVDVYNNIIERRKYNNNEKYKQFIHWRPVNTWQITIQNSINQHNDIQQNINQHNNIEQNHINYTTILQCRETRQQLQYDLNQLLYFFIGLKHECSQINNKLKLDSSSISMTQNQLSVIISNIQKLIALISSKLLLTPIQLKCNKKSYQNFISKFDNISKNISTLTCQIEDYKGQINLLENQRENQVKKLQQMRKKQQMLKKWKKSYQLNLLEKMSKYLGRLINLNEVILVQQL